MTYAQALSGAECDLESSFVAMACRVSIRLPAATPRAQVVFDRVRRLFADVESCCSRFDADSPLMRANARGDYWRSVPRYCLDAIGEAASAYVQTSYLFDPRILGTLRALGYDRSFTDLAPGRAAPGERTAAAPIRRRWSPGIDGRRGRVRVGPDPIDLGGIGKGLALRWASRILAEQASSFFIEAGGDCYLSGTGPHGQGWDVGIQDPLSDAAGPIAVVRVQDAACATSSVLVRRWQAGQRTVHHLIDPRTAEPGGLGLLAVTVVAADPADAEVWSKVLFLHAADGIADAAASTGHAALWVFDDGRVQFSESFASHLLWQRS